MKFRLILFYLLAFCCTRPLDVLAFTGDSSGVDPDPDVFHTVLFEVRAPGSEQVSYLFGTHHSFGKTFFDSLHIANEKLRGSEVMIKESMEIPGKQAEDIINGRKKTTKWPRYLDRTDLEYVEDVFSNSQLDLNRLTPTELHLVMARIYRYRVCGAREASDPSNSLDDYIGTVAVQNGLLLIGLETPKEQLEIIQQDVKDMPRKVHKKRLHRLIERLQSDDTSHCGEIEKYIAMDYDYRLNRPCRNALVLTDRNARWMPIILEQINKNSCFIAVGLSHLMFECGLISQLRDQGYSVTPLAVK